MSWSQLRVDAEAPPRPGSPEPWSAASSRAGGRKDRTEPQSRASKGGNRRPGTLDPETQRDSDSEPRSKLELDSGSSLDAAKAACPLQRRMARPPYEIGGQSCLCLHVHIYRQKCPWGEEAKENM